MKLASLSLLTLTLTLFVSLQAHAECAEEEGAHASQEKTSDISRAVAENSKDKVALHVSKMSCISCASKIKKTLKTEYSIKDVKIDVETKTVTFACPTKTCSVDKVLLSMDKIGYKATQL